VTVAFTLPAGSYATVLLRELMKSPDDSAATTETEALASEPTPEAEPEPAP
jgi:tRNA(Glu) U13 pseudouridine synthase TruD